MSSTVSNPTPRRSSPITLAASRSVADVEAACPLPAGAPANGRQSPGHRPADQLTGIQDGTAVARLVGIPTKALRVPIPHTPGASPQTAQTADTLAACGVRPPTRSPDRAALMRPPVLKPNRTGDLARISRWAGNAEGDSGNRCSRDPMPAIHRSASSRIARFGRHTAFLPLEMVLASTLSPNSLDRFRHEAIRRIDLRNIARRSLRTGCSGRRDAPGRRPGQPAA